MSHRHSKLTTTVLVLTLTFWVAHAFLCVTSPQLYARFILKDGATAAHGPTLLDHGVENLTVATLIPGVLFGAAAVLEMIKRRAPVLMTLWVAGWTAAALYFAGEECSWGQWYLGFNTPETWQHINDQGETNLHNTSSWLDQKPRAAVELFIIVGGLVAPALAPFSRRPSRVLGHPLVEWALAPSTCWAAAAVFLVLRLLSWLPSPLALRMADSEVRELAVAAFMMLYLLAYPTRVRAAFLAERDAVPEAQTAARRGGYA